MSRAVALSALRARVRTFADIGPDTTSSSSRWPNSKVNTEINASWQRMREKMCETDGGRSLFGKVSSGTTTSGATAPFSWTVLTMPADCVRVLGIEVVLENGRYRSLSNVSWTQRNEYYGMFGIMPGPPLHFFIYNMGTESGSSVTAGSIGLVPATDRAYTYNLWELPSWVDRSSDTDVFDGIAGCDDWAVWDAVEKIAIADGAEDGGMGGIMAAAMREREKAEEAIVKIANTVQAVGPVKRIDTASMQRGEMNAERWRWWP